MQSIRRLPALAGLIAAALPLASCGAVAALTGDDTCLEVQGTFDPRAPSYIILYKAGVPVQATTDALAAKYGFTPTYVWDVGLEGFAAPLTNAAVEGVRCEPVVKVIEHDGFGAHI